MAGYWFATTQNEDGYMDCPVCSNVKLVMSERQGIEIDYCPNCRGVWLDRGELDKIIDKSTDGASQPIQRQERDDRYREQQRHPQDYEQTQRSRGYPPQDHHKRKRKGFLGELFDFD
jgi:Zn-finger nucleic acid-binding protein